MGLLEKLFGQGKLTDAQMRHNATVLGKFMRAVSPTTGTTREERAQLGAEALANHVFCEKCFHQFELLGVTGFPGPDDDVCIKCPKCNAVLLEGRRA